MTIKIINNGSNYSGEDSELEKDHEVLRVVPNGYVIEISYYSHLVKEKRVVYKEDAKVINELPAPRIDTPIN